MNNRETVLLTVFATLLVEVVIAFIAVLWITGGNISFGPFLRDVDAKRRANKIHQMGLTIEGGKSISLPAPPPSDVSCVESGYGKSSGSYREWRRAHSLTDRTSLEFEEWRSAKNIKKGDKATVPDWAWVTVKNADPVPSGNNLFAYGDSCGIQRGGTVTAVGIEGNRLLVRYSIAGTQYGTPCPSGVLFFTNKETFSAMTGEYNKVRNAEKNEKKLVRRLLGK